MTERYDQDKILGYVEGELSDDQRAGFEAVLADDHELRQLVSQLKLDRQALRGLGTSRAPVGLIDQVIQTHERSALLGDPAAPEPLPLTVPVNRWKFRRTAAYGAIAAVLILSFGLVFQTLIPPDLLNRGTQVAQHDPATDQADTRVPDVGSGIALLDEDIAYDALDARALGRQRADKSADASKPDSVVGKLESRLAEAEGLDQVAEADSIYSERDTVELKAARTAEADLKLGSELEYSEAVPGEKRVAAGAFADASQMQRDDIAKDSGTPESGVGLDGNVEGALAMAEPTHETDANRFKKQVLADAFAGYGVAPGDTPTQLVVNSSSPTQARRDIRDWANANSVRLVEEPTQASTFAFGSGGRSAGGYGGAAGSGLAGQAGIDSPKPGDDSRETRENSLRRQVQLETADGKAFTQTAGTRYYVLIDRGQVPSLLTYLNRTQGQRAELIDQPPVNLSREAQPVTATADATNELFYSSQDGAAGPTPADAQKDETAELAEVEVVADAPKATANRLVDTESGWFNNSRTAPAVRGLTTAPTDPGPARRNETREAPVEQEKQDRSQDNATEADPQDDRSAKNKEEARNGSTRQPTYFDWNRLLEPRRRAAPLTTAAAAAEPSEKVEEEAARDTRLRLEVIIQQTADEASSPEDEKE